MRISIMRPRTVDLDVLYTDQIIILRSTPISFCRIRA